MHKRSPSLRNIVTARRLIYLVLIFVALYGVLPKVPTFIISPGDLQSLRPYWLILSMGAFGITYGLSAGIYYILLGGRLHYRRTIIVQMAATFADRLLPAGSGALGVNYLFLRKQQVASGQAIALVAANNLLGLIGHLILLVSLLLFFPKVLRHSQRIDISISQWIIATMVIVGLFAAIALAKPRLRMRLQKVITDAMAALVSYARNPVATIPALILAMSLTTAYATCLYAVATAVGVPFTPLEALIVLTFGVAAGTAIPTPGGLGGAEAGLIAGLISFGVATHSALIIALLYRLITFWLALLIGAIAFMYLERRQYIQLPSGLNTTK